MKRKYLIYFIMIINFMFIISCTAFKGDRFVKLSGGVVKDNETGLMWSIYDNGIDITWESASAYCITYTKGHFANWRMPTIIELETILKPDAGKKSEAMNYIQISGKNIWTSNIDPTNTKAGYYAVQEGSVHYGPKYGGFRARALPVRKFE